MNWQRGHIGVEVSNQQDISEPRSAQTDVLRLVAWPTCVCIIAAHLSWSHSDYPTEARFYAGIVGCIAVLCLAYSPRGALPALGLTMAHFYGAMGIPTFYPAFVDTLAGPLRISGRGLNSAALGAAVVAMTATITSLLVARTGVRLGQWIQKWFGSETERLSAAGAPALVVGLTSLTLGTLALLGLRFGALNNPIGMLGSPLIFLSTLWWRAENLRTASSWNMVWGSALGFALLGATTGMLGSLLLPGLIAGALLWRSHGKLPVGLLALGLAGVVIFNPAKAEYRRLAWRSDVSFSERITLWGDALDHTWGSDQTDVAEGFQSAARRMNALCQVGQIFDWTPGRIAHAGPERWLNVPLMFIPRAIWREKPEHAQYFNRNYTYTFHLQHRRTSGSTYITLPIVGDGYWRMGWLGVLMEGLLWGSYVGLAFGISRAQSCATLLCAVALLQLRPEDHAFGNLNGTVQRVIIALSVAALMRLLRTPRQADQTSAFHEPTRAVL